MTIDDENRPGVPDETAGNLLLWASGFGLGALVVLLGFIFLIGIHVVGNAAPTGGAPPAAQSGAPAAPQTAGQAPAPSGPPQSQ